MNLKLVDSLSRGRIKTKRRRPGDSQREQKEITRRRLLNAAQAVFEHYPYSAVAVDMLAERAGVSRTTFYRHFDGRLAVVQALFGDVVPLLKRQWRSLFEHPNLSLKDMHDWVEGLVKVSFTNPVLNRIFAEIEAIEPEVQVNKYRYYDEILGMLGLQGIGGEALEQVKARFVLLMLQIDQFLYLIRSDNLVVQRAELVSAMAELIHDFMETVQQRVR